jgi:hypothetical protein
MNAMYGIFLFSFLHTRYLLCALNGGLEVISGGFCFLNKTAVSQALCIILKNFESLNFGKKRLS